MEVDINKKMSMQKKIVISVSYVNTLVRVVKSRYTKTFLIIQQTLWIDF